MRKKVTKTPFTNIIFGLTDDDWKKYKKLKKLMGDVNDILAREENQYPKYVKEIKNLKTNILKLKIGKKYFYEYEIGASKLLTLYIERFWKVIMLNRIESLNERYLKYETTQKNNIALKNIQLQKKELELQLRSLDLKQKDFDLIEKKIEIREISDDLRIEEDKTEFFYNISNKKGKWIHLKTDIDKLWNMGYSQINAIKYLVELNEDKMIKRELAKNKNNNIKLVKNIERSLYRRKN